MRGFLSTGKPASPLGKPLPYQIKYVGLCLLLRVVSIRRATDGRRTSRQHDWLSAVSTQAGRQGSIPVTSMRTAERKDQLIRKGFTRQQYNVIEKQHFFTIDSNTYVLMEEGRVRVTRQVL